MIHGLCFVICLCFFVAIQCLYFFVILKTCYECHHFGTCWSWMLKLWKKMLVFVSWYEIRIQSTVDKCNQCDLWTLILWFFYVFVFTALLVLYFVLLSEWPAIGTFLPWIWFECLNCGLESKVFSVLMCSKDEKHSFVICLCVLSDGFLFLLKFGFCFKKIPVMSAFLLWIWYLLIGMIGLSIKIWSFFLGIKLGWENMVDSSNHCGLQSWFCEKNLPFLVKFFFKNVLFEGNTCYVCLWAVDLMLAYMTAWITDKNQGLRVRVCVLIYIQDERHCWKI